MWNEDAREEQLKHTPGDAEAEEKPLSPSLSSESSVGRQVPPDTPEGLGGRFYDVPPILASDTPPFSETLAVYLFSGVLFIFLGFALQSLQLFVGLILSQIVLLAGPAYLYTVFRKYNVSRTFFFVPIRLRTAVLTVTIACAAFALMGIVALFQELLLPRSSEYIAVWKDVMLEFRQASPVLVLFIIAVLPGVCEELLFRGFLLQGMRKKMPDVPAVLLVGILFGLFHFDPYRLLPTSLLGILFGCLVVKTGSIFPAMLAHGLNNTFVIFLAYCALQGQDAEQLAGSPPIEESFTLKGLLGLLPVAAGAIAILWAALRALPGEHGTPPTDS